MYDFYAHKIENVHVYIRSLNKNPPSLTFYKKYVIDLQMIQVPVLQLKTQCAMAEY